MASSRISGITIEIGGDTSSLSKALQSVNNEIKSTQTQLKDVEKLLKFDPTNTELLAQKQKALTTEIADTKTKLETMRTAADQANDALAKGEISQQQYDALQREIIATEQELKNLCNRAAEANETLQKIGAVGTTLQNVGSSMTSLGKSLTMGVTMPLAAIGTAAVKTSMDFDSAMSQVAATMGTTTDQIQDLADCAKEMGATTAFSATEAAEGLNVLAMAGLSADEQIAALPEVLNLASAGAMSLENAATYTVGAVNGFGDSMDNAAYYTDLMAKGATLSNTSVAQLGEALGASAATASGYGQTADSVTLSLLRLANQNQTGSEAATKLMRAMADLYTPTDAAAAAMDELGVSAYTSSGQARDFNVVVDELDAALSQMSDQERATYEDTIFTTNGMKAFDMMTASTTETVNGFKEGLEEASGSAAQQAATQLDNLSGQMTLLSSAISAVLQDIGEALTPIISKAVEVVQNLADKFHNLDEGTKEMIVTIGLVAAAIGPVLTIFGTLTSTVGSALSAISSLGTKLLGLVYQAQAGVGPLAALQTAIAGITAPVAAVIAVVGTLVAAFTTLWNTNEEFRDAITGIWEEIKNTVGNFIQGVIDRINDLGFSFEGIGDIVETVKEIWINFCNVIAPLFEGAFQLVSSALSYACDQILAVLDIFIGMFTGNWEQCWQGVSDFVSNIWNGICSLIETLASTIWNIIGNILGLINADWQTQWSDIGEFISNIWENIKSAVSNALDTILSTVGNVLGNIVSTIQNGLNSAKDFILNLASEAIQWGSELITNLANGIKNAIGKITDAVKGVADKIKSFLHFSVPDEGPLTDLMNWMPDMVQTLADGINDGAAVVEAACSQLANAAMTALESGLNQSLSIAQNFTSSMTSLWQNWLNNMTSSTTSFISSITASISSFLSTLQSNITSFLTSVESTLNQKLSTFTQNIQQFLQTTQQNVQQALQSMQQTTEQFLEALQTAIDQFLQTTQQDVSQALQEIQQLTETTMQALDQTVQQYMTSISTNITTLITEAITNYTAQVNTLESVTRGGFEPAVSYIQGLIPQFRQWGIDMMQNLIDGIKAKEDELRREMEKLASMMSDYMEFSVPKKGPLSNADTYMPDMMKLFAEGIKDNKSLVTDQLKGLAGDMSLITNDSSSTNPTINLNAETVVTLDGKVLATSMDKYLGVAYG